MQSKVYEEIEHVVNKIRDINGVAGIALFGSYSRGDYDEGSDIDLLVVFRDKTTLEKGSKRMYRATAETDLLFQVIGLTMEELKNSPLLDSVLREGKIYCVEQELRSVLTRTHKPYALVTYSTANLKAKERVTFTHKLEGRRRGKYRYDGLIDRLGGFKVGRGVLMVPLENLKKLTGHLEEEKVNYVMRYVWI